MPGLQKKPVKNMFTPDKKILLAEHDTFLINIYARRLRELGYTISIATDGQLLVSRIKNISPDLLIMEACLPQSNNLIIIKTMREELGLKDLKVVILADFGEDRQDAPELGVLKFFPKAEGTAEELAQEVKRILS